MNARVATIKRHTKETRIDLSLKLDGAGKSKIRTGIPFFDHMLTLFAKHAVADLNVEDRVGAGLRDLVRLAIALRTAEEGADLATAGERRRGKKSAAHEERACGAGAKNHEDLSVNV